MRAAPSGPSPAHEVASKRERHARLLLDFGVLIGATALAIGVASALLARLSRAEACSS